MAKRKIAMSMNGEIESAKVVNGGRKTCVLCTSCGGLREIFLMKIEKRKFMGCCLGDGLKDYLLDDEKY